MDERYEIRDPVLGTVACFYYHNLMIGGGFWGYMAGIIYLFHLSRAQYALAIGCIATAILTVMYFPWEFSLKGYLQVGVAWSMTIIGPTAVLTVVSCCIRLWGRRSDW